MDRQTDRRTDGHRAPAKRYAYRRAVKIDHLKSCQMSTAYPVFGTPNRNWYGQACTLRRVSFSSTASELRIRRFSKAEMRAQASVQTMKNI